MLQLLHKPCMVLLGASCMLSGVSATMMPATANPNPVFSEQPAVATEKTAPATNQQKAVQVQANSRVLVMIDPGHGGKDSGAIGVDGLREVDVILPIALRVAEILNKSGVETKK